MDEVQELTPDVDSGQEVSHYSGQNCTGWVVAEWNFGRRQRLVSSGRMAREYSWRNAPNSVRA